MPLTLSDIGLSAAQPAAWETALKQAREAAHKAGQEWLDKARDRGPRYNVMEGRRVVGQLLDVCGNAYLIVKDKRTKFAKFIQAKEEARNRRRGYSPRTWRGSWLIIHLDHGWESRQEMGLHEACTRAALEVFRAAGLGDELRFHSYID